MVGGYCGFHKLPAWTHDCSRAQCLILNNLLFIMTETEIRFGMSYDDYLEANCPLNQGQ